MGNSIVRAGVLGWWMAAVVICGVAAEDVPDDGSSNNTQTTVGIPVEVLGVVAPGELLQAKGVREDSPALVRVIEVYPHGTDHRYDLEFRALESGRFNVLDYLETAAGATPEGLDPVWVDVLPLLPSSQLQPHALQASETPALGGYLLLTRIAIAVWVIVLLELLRRNFMPKRSHPAVRSQTRTLYQELKSLIDQILKSNDSQQVEWARLESLLLAYWREKLNLQGLDAHEALRLLHEHPEAGQVLRQVEDWLHRPDPPQSIAWDELLGPYRDAGPLGGAASHEVAS